LGGLKNLIEEPTTNHCSAVSQLALSQLVGDLRRPERRGVGNWDLKNPDTLNEFQKLQKYFTRGFRDPKPRAIPIPYGIPGGDREA
jgi:hypothetical protein